MVATIRKDPNKDVDLTCDQKGCWTDKSFTVEQFRWCRAANHHQRGDGGGLYLQSLRCLSQKSEQIQESENMRIRLNI
jgi:hypothetical protein